MKLVSEAFKWFLYITTGTLIVTAIIFTLSGEDMISVNTLWKLLLASLLTTIVTVCLRPAEEKNVGGYILNYIALCMVMIVCGRLFDWIDFSLWGILLMMAAVAGVYMISFVAYWLVDRKQAEEINKMLKKRYKD